MNVPFHHRFLSRSCRGTALSRAHPRKRCARLTDLKVGHYKTLAPVGAAFLGGRLSSVLPRLKGGGMIGKGEGRERRKNLRTGGQRQKIVRLLSIRPRFEVLVEGFTLSTHRDDYVYPMTRWSLYIEHVSSILEVRNSLVLRQFPMTSVRLDSTHRVDALMRTRSVGLHDAPYAKVLRHLRFLTISTHNGQGNWADLYALAGSWVDIAHGPPNRASAGVYRNFHQRCTCAGSSIPIQNSPFSRRWQ